MRQYFVASPAKPGYGSFMQDADSLRRARRAFHDSSYLVRRCDRCARRYRGPALYCSLACALADGSGDSRRDVLAAVPDFAMQLRGQASKAAPALVFGRPYGVVGDPPRGCAAVDYAGRRWFYRVREGEHLAFRIWLHAKFGGGGLHVRGRWPIYRVEP